MAYKKGDGAAAVAGYGSATRDVTATEKMWGGIESLWGSAQDVGASIALKKGEADTAWGEYEAGYKELGGEGFERPKFGQKGYFKGPEGEVTIGKKIYDRGQIRKAGSFLGTDTATVLFAGEKGDDMRTKYLERTAPGREVTYDAPFQETEAGGWGVDPKPRGRKKDITVDTPVYSVEKHAPDYYKQLHGGTAQTTAQTIEQSPVEQDVPVTREDDDVEEDKFNLPDYFKGKIQRMIPKIPKIPTFGFQQGEKAYARGGDFITNGPEKIIVGDNPGGRERVIVEPLPPKEGKSDHDEAKFGRYGDDRMKRIDGALAHISPIEEDMSPEDIKKYGAGTINPITGKKEYFAPLMVAGAVIGGGIKLGGILSGNKKKKAAREAAEKLKAQQLALAEEEKDLALEVGQQVSTYGQKSIGLQSTAATEDIFAQSAQQTAGAGMATQGTIENIKTSAIGDVTAKAQSDVQNLVATRALKAKQTELGFEKTEMGIEQQYQSMLAANQQTGLLEGIGQVAGAAISGASTGMSLSGGFAPTEVPA
jgi:hypothetical protein